MRAVLRRRAAQDDRRGAAGRSPTRLRVDAVSIGTPKSASTRRQRRRHRRHAARATRGWASASPTSARPSTASLQTVAGGGGITGVGVNALLGQFQKQTGLDLRKDVLGWMGDAGVFVGGTTSADLGGALVIKTTDPAKTKRTMAVLERFARQQSARHEDQVAARQRHRRGLHGAEPDRAGRPGRPRRRSLRGRHRRQGRPGPGDQARPAARLLAGLHRGGGQARQRPAAVVLSRLHPGDEADRVLRRRRTPASSRPSPTSTPSARSSPAPRTRARASPASRFVVTLPS